MGQPVQVKRKRETKGQRAKRLQRRQEWLSSPLPAPFEHLDGAWWQGVIDQLDGKTGEESAESGGLFAEDE